MWEISINDQMLTLLYSLCLGVILCVFYDVFKAFHKAGFDSPLQVFIGDILYCVIAAFATFLLLLSRTNGEIRGYVLVATLVGFIITRFTLSHITVFLFTKILVFITGVWQFLNYNILRFLIIGGRYIGRFFKKIIKKMSTALKYIKKLLKSAIHLLYTKKNNDSVE